MTRTQSGAHWSGIPSPSQLLLAAVLRLAAMFVQGVVHPLQMLLSRLPRECRTDVTPDRLPATENGNHTKEEPAEEHSQPIAGLMPRDREPIVSKHKTVLINSLNESFSGKARSAASRESRFERHGDRRSTPQSPPSSNRDFRDALRLPENDSGCRWELSPRPRL